MVELIFRNEQSDILCNVMINENTAIISTGAGKKQANLLQPGDTFKFPDGFVRTISEVVVS